MQPQAAEPRAGDFIQTARHTLWRGIPAAFRRRALARATGWLASRPSPTAATTSGIVIAGEMTRASGLGESARLMAAAARHLGLPVWTIDLPPPVDATPEVAAHPSDAPLSDALLSDAPPPNVPLVLHVNAPMLPLALLRLPGSVTRNRPIVGYWAWEMPQVPPEWLPALACVTEVWVPSRFTAAALEPLLPGRIRIVPPALAVVPPVPSSLDRAAFGLPQDAVIVLVSFNLASSFSRKNPFAAVAAFHGAFGDRCDRLLLLRVTHPEHAPRDFARLTQMAQAPNIRVDTRVLPPQDRHALTACADIVLSLHRGEGFGLVLAEAMLLGKPVVATGWSGNTDFMDGGNSSPVAYRLAPARDDRHVYRGLWAEPDVADAADRLRALADDPVFRRRLGDKAQSTTRLQLGAGPLATALEGLR